MADIKKFWNQLDQETRAILLDKAAIFPDSTIQKYKKKTWGVIERDLSDASFSLTRLAGFVNFMAKEAGF